jgi:hypothetical protein
MPDLDQVVQLCPFAYHGIPDRSPIIGGVRPYFDIVLD